MTSKPKYKLRSARSFGDVRLWWNTVVDVKVKAIVLTGVWATFTMLGFQYQVNTVTNDRIDASCQLRIDGRNDLRDTLFAIVDLSDLYKDENGVLIQPIPEGIIKYHDNRVALIDAKWPVITEKDCP